MDRIRIRGGRPLEGRISIGGAKNAALPLMTAALLTDETLTLENLPFLADITTLSHLLVQHGASITMTGAAREAETGHTLALSARNIVSTTAPYDLVRKMRASILVLGPLLARCGEARVSLPGGCAIGTRPVDLHIAGLERLGATIELKGGYIDARAPGGLTGAEIVFAKPSVGATENLLMAASLARGTTVLVNAAREPEIGDLLFRTISDSFQRLSKSRANRRLCPTEVGAAEIFDLRQRQTDSSQATHHFNTPQRVLPEEPVVPWATSCGIDQSQVFVLAKHLDRHPTSTRQAADGHHRRPAASAGDSLPPESRASASMICSTVGRSSRHDGCCSSVFPVTSAPSMSSVGEGYGPSNSSITTRAPLRARQSRKADRSWSINGQSDT